jgi:hypothetical protein
MSGFVEGIDRSQSSLFPAALEDYVAEDNLVRAVDAFVEGLDLGKLGFGLRQVPAGAARAAACAACIRNHWWRYRGHQQRSHQGNFNDQSEHFCLPAL